jgi:hypothetical protein
MMEKIQKTSNSVFRLGKSSVRFKEWNGGDELSGFPEQYGITAW